MMSGDKPVRFIRAWQTYSVGQVITPSAAFGETLVLNRLAEYLPEEKQKAKRKRKAKKNANNVSNSTD